MCREAGQGECGGGRGGPTLGPRWLQVISGQRTPAHREDVAGVVAAVVIEGSSPAVEGDQHLAPSHLPDGGRADEVRVLAVHRLQLHAHLEGVLRRGRGLLLWVRGG